MPWCLQYFNIPVTRNTSDPAHPLSILKKLTTPDDFVVLKLDIDVPAIEDLMIQEIMSDYNLNMRIDEMFYEVHVNFPPMNKAWRHAFDNLSVTMADAYTAFDNLRRLGIRMHGWP